jgi:DNA-binding CsgD family transcriptional regulator
VSIDSAAILLTDTIPGYNDDALETTLTTVGASIGVRHIAYLRLSPENSADAIPLTSVVTYPKLWQDRHSEKKYLSADPVISHGKNAVLLYDLHDLLSGDPAILDFFADAASHGVGPNGFQLLAVLIDSAASINLKLSSLAVKLSKREEQCLIWVVRGKTYQDIYETLNISYGSVKTYLDAARHKLNCINLTHAVAVAVATGLIPSKALVFSAP